jgi:hypothetical protein
MTAQFLKQAGGGRQQTEAGGKRTEFQSFNVQTDGLFDAHNIWVKQKQIFSEPVFFHSTIHTLWRPLGAFHRTRPIEIYFGSSHFHP